MKDDLAKHFKKENRPSRKAVLVFLDSPAFGDEVFSMHDVVPGPDASFENVNAGTLWSQISDLLTKEQTEVLRLRLDGYTDREIAARNNRRLKYVEELFAGIREAATLCVAI
jgi:DNA-directed RNA polymerase specialized sigma24 family protein